MSIFVYTYLKSEIIPQIFSTLYLVQQKKLDEYILNFLYSYLYYSFTSSASFPLHPIRLLTLLPQA